MRKPLTQEEKEAQKHWERITEILARQQGPLEVPARLLSFDELWEDVVKNATTIINELYKQIYEDKKVDLYKLIGNVSLSSGLPLDN